MPVSQFTHEQISEAAEALTHQVGDICAGKPTAAVYIAIGSVLGNMEMRAQRPDREGLFKILSGAMDIFINNNQSRL